LRLIPADLLAVATPAEQAAYERALQFEVALSSPLDFAELVHPLVGAIDTLDGPLQRPRWIEYLNQKIVALTAGQLTKPDGKPYRRMLVSAPVRHGKSFTTSIYTPAWYLANNPGKKVGFASYEATFAAKFGGIVRDIMEAAPDGLASKPRRNSRASAQWDLDSGGGMFTAGAGGPITGRGFHLIVVDDPIKNFQDAMSEVVRERVNSWFYSTVLTRLEPGGVVIVLAARWHEDDLPGRIMADDPEEWYHVSLPALAGNDCPLGRRPGEALWPERYDEVELAKIRASQNAINPMNWPALYQQQPYIEGGGIFRGEKARFYARHSSDKGPVLSMQAPGEAPVVVPESRLQTFGVVDLAASTRTSADFSVFSLWGVTPPSQRGDQLEDTRRLLLLDCFRARIEGADHMATLERLHKSWKPAFWGIERATFGLSLIQTASRTGRIPVRELKPDWDKVSRAFGAAALMEAGRLWFPRDAPWMDDWLAELLAFDKGRHDDCVDVTAYAAFLLNQRLMPPRRHKEPDRDDFEGRIWAQLRDKRKKGLLHPELGAM
jgi:predicted phage terminase large subunit-like protein